jgi:hypothetical protein
MAKYHSDFKFEAYWKKYVKQGGSKDGVLKEFAEQVWNAALEANHQHRLAVINSEIVETD